MHTGPVRAVYDVEPIELTDDDVPHEPAHELAPTDERVDA